MPKTVKKIIRPVQKVEKTVARAADRTLDEVSTVINTTESKIEKTVVPIRQSVIKRFPILFLLAVTFGITATATGMEQLILRYEIMRSHPAAILLIGVVTLIMTGTVYKKLG